MTVTARGVAWLILKEVMRLHGISESIVSNRDTTFKGVKQFAQQAVWNLLDVHDAILEHRIEQMHYSNKCCRPGIEYQINDLVYLSTKNFSLPKHRA